MQDLFYKVIIELQEEGGFTAYVPKLPGCVSEGETYNKTLNNIKEALQLYVDVMLERRQIIVNDDIKVTEVCVAL